MSCKSSFRSFSFYSKHDTVSDSRYLLICRNARRDAINDPSGFPGARAGVDFHRGYKGKHLPKEYIERGQIYFGFEVDEKLLPFAVEEFGDQCWVYGSDIPHGNRLYGAVDVFLKRNDISEESKRKLLIDNTARLRTLSPNLFPLRRGKPVLSEVEGIEMRVQGKSIV